MPETRWTIDRRVPAWGLFLFGIGLLGQMTYATWQTAVASERITHLEQRQAALDNVPAQLSRIEGILDEMRREP